MSSRFTLYCSNLLPRNWTNSILAVLMMIVIIFWITLMWPVSHLGFATDLRTHQVLEVKPDGPAARAGLQVEDRIVSLYGQPYVKVLHSLNFVSFLGLTNRIVPIVVERGEQTVTVKIAQDQPSHSFQTTKLAMTALALICYATGYVLGVVRHHQVPGSPFVAAYWLAMGGMISSLFFASYVSLPIYVSLLWLFTALFVPLTIHIHFWFPPRSTPARAVRKKASLYIFGISLLINCSIAVGASVSKTSMIDLMEFLQSLLPLAVAIALISSGWILYRAYQHATYAHTRRQIRLIGITVVAIALIWVLLQIIPRIVIGHDLIQSRWLTLLGGAVPLAYLAGGVASDLYPIDRIASRLLVHLLTATVLVTFFYLFTGVLGLRGTPTVTWIAVAFVVFYRPVQHGLSHILPIGFDSDHEYRALDRATNDLSRSLDASTLGSTLVRGAQEQFGRPALAFFLGDISGTNELTLQIQHRMEDMPQKILPGSLTDELRRVAPVAEQWTVRRDAQKAPLTLEEEQLLTHSACVLWCPIRHSQGHLLGLLLLGMRDDLDDYRVRDQQKLEQLIVAAHLAFSNSAAFTQLREAEEINRQLYQRLQEAKDAAASDLSRELHDEIINGFLLTNVTVLEQIAEQIPDSSLQTELCPVIENEQNAIDSLRGISEALYPTGLDDPFGLPQVLRLQVEKWQARWRKGRCELQVSGLPQPVAAKTQNEARRIAGEAMANAVKHANASTITVHLHYPTTPGESINLVIHDDGRNAGSVDPKGHMGVHGMKLGARIAGGELSIQSKIGVGTTIVFMFGADPCCLIEADEELAAHESA